MAEIVCRSSTHTRNT